MVETTTLTLLLTDLVDSTALLARVGDARGAAIMGRHDRVARDLLAAHGGREIDKSDGFLHTFEQPEAAVRYALAYHAACRALTRAEGVRLTARCGLHTGAVRLIHAPPEDVARGAKPVEVEGIAKATAARIMTVARGGQTLLSPDTRAALGDREDLPTLSHGHYRLKGVDAPLELFAVVPPGAAPLPPPPDSDKVHRVVEVGGSWRPAADLPHNLPPDRVAFFGRAGELRAVAAAFGEGAGLVSLVGPGGGGKSHLARRYAGAWMGDWPGGAWLCDLAEATTAIDVAAALGAALDVPLADGDPTATIGEALSARGRALVLLDTFEQLVEVAGPTLEAWRRQAPQVAWLVTSRQRLGLRGERLVPVEPLPLPPADASPADLQDNPAACLFIDRARAVQPRFTVTPDNAADIAEVVRLLDGLPLALELAAARVRVLPPKRILQRMGRRFDLLKGRGSARQATLRGALDWSWELLEPWEQAALATCAVFEGSFDLEAAEAVLDLSDWPDAPWPMDAVESLVDKSLVRTFTHGQGDVRFGLFRSIHDYAHEKLADPEAREAAVLRHAAHYARWGEDGERARLMAPDGAETARRLQADLDNVLAAARRAAAQGRPDVSAAAALGALALLRDRGPFPLADEVAQVALAAGPSPALAARLQLALGEVRNRAGRAEAAALLLEVARDTAAGLGDAALEGAARAAAGHGALLQGQVDRAREAFEAALRLQRVAGDALGEAATLTELAHVVGIRGGEFAAAEAHLDRAEALRGAADPAGRALAASYRGALRCIQGDFETGRAAYEQARSLARTVGDRRTAGLSEGMIAGICVLTGHLDEARAFFEAALATQRAIGDRVHEAMHAANYADLLARLGEVTAAEAQLDRAISIARETGATMTEGLALGALGKLLADAGDLDRGHARLLEGEARLRQAGDPAELAKLLCTAGEVALARGDKARARAHLVEAWRIASDLGLAEGSEVRIRVAALQERVGDAGL